MRGNKRSLFRPKRHRLLGLGLAALTVGIALPVVMRVRSGSAPETLAPVEGVPGISHVHGLGVNPADELLYVATHHGVFTVDDQGRAERIANRYQDTMGFTIAGPDRFLASGHPDFREEDEPLLGLIESTDRARTWKKRSLLGEADFHVLRFAHGRVYGFNSSSGELMTSNTGKDWETLTKAPLRDFVVSPDDEKVLLGTTLAGLHRSMDGGRTFDKIGSPAEFVLMSWSIPTRMRSVALDGRVWASHNQGNTWEEVGQLPAGGPQAMSDDGAAMHVAVQSGIYSSDDAGRTWQLVYETG